MYDKILVAVDHSATSDRALLAARDLALLSHGEVWVLHLREREIAVKTGVAMMDETESDANAAVSAAVDKLTEVGREGARRGADHPVRLRRARTSSTTRSRTTPTSS